MEKEFRGTTTHLAGAAGWVAAVIVWVANWFVDERSLATLALMLCAVAVTLSVRGFLMSRCDEIKNAMVVLNGAKDGDVRFMR